jgi:hypothetical protein
MRKDKEGQRRNGNETNSSNRIRKALKVEDSREKREGRRRDVDETNRIDRIRKPLRGAESQRSLKRLEEAGKRWEELETAEEISRRRMNESNPFQP